MDEESSENMLRVVTIAWSLAVVASHEANIHGASCGLIMLSNLLCLSLVAYSHHAGEAYIVCTNVVALATSKRAFPEMPWNLRVPRAYKDNEADARTPSRCKFILRSEVMVTPSTPIELASAAPGIIKPST